MKFLLLCLICILFSNCLTGDKKQDPLNLEIKLAGKWKAKAFDGELHEEWILGEYGRMPQVIVQKQG
jgi:hypothetical protein